ncbi:MAG TPA: DUF202 domain-containing protein [Streptosporangiaceae bacterium]
MSHRDDRDANGEPPASAPGDYEESRPVLASERTDLAWTRSAIAFIALGAAILKIRPAVGLPVMGLGGAIWLLPRISPRRGNALTSRRTLLVTIAVTSLAVVSVVLTLAGPPSRGLRP